MQEMASRPSDPLLPAVPAAAASRDGRHRGRPRSGRVHRAILDATRERLIEDGFAGLRLEHVAAQAGVGKAAIYRRWSSKEALALELDDGSISVSAVGALAGAALFGPRAALVLAVAICVVQWSAQRQQIHRVLFNIGTLTLSSLAATCVFMLGFDGALGVVAGDPVTLGRTGSVDFGR